MIPFLTATAIAEKILLKIATVSLSLEMLLNDLIIRGRWAENANALGFRFGVD